MVLGRRRDEFQQDLMVPTSALPRSLGHLFYVALNAMLSDAQFDKYVEDLGAPLYRDDGHPSTPPIAYSRIPFAGYFEGIHSQRGIARRCSHSLSLRSFLELKPTEATPGHSSLTIICERLPKELIEQVFPSVQKLAFEQKMLNGKAIGIDSTTLEADAAMKSIVREDGGATWKAYRKQLAEEAGIDDPSDAEQRRFDKKRKGKKANEADSEVGKDTVVDAQSHLNNATDQQCKIIEAVADRGYHKASTLASLEERGIRSFIPERGEKRKRRWRDKQRLVTYLRSAAESTGSPAVQTRRHTQ